MFLAERNNEGKPEYSLLDLRSFEPCVRALEYGARKYSRDNWKLGMTREKILDSLMRHIAALLGGEDVDSESGVSHIGHIQANAMFLAYNSENRENA